MSKVMKGFLSDNSSSVHEKVMKALVEANAGHSYPYGDDPYTRELENLMKTILGPTAMTTVVMNGTGANVIGLSALVESFNSVLCVDSAHVNVDECGAFECMTGAKLIAVPGDNGKLDIKLLGEHLKVLGNFHHNQPKVVSISQVTEMGSVYTIRELKDITAYAHANGLLVHMDGARISNACVSLGVSFKEMVTDTGIDIVSFGGTKNGLMYGELVVVFDEKIHKKLAYLRKQGMQLASKMRYVSAQFLAFFKDDLWKECAVAANAMCAKLYKQLKEIGDVTFVATVDANIMFIHLPVEWLEHLEKNHYFYTIDHSTGLIRLVTSFDTKEEEIDRFVHDIRVAKASHETLMD